MTNGGYTRASAMQLLQFYNAGYNHEIDFSTSMSSMSVKTTTFEMACKQEVLNLSITGDVICKAVKSFALSKRYTQIMVKSSILNILYQRLVLNETDLKIKKYEDIPFVVFKRKTVKDPLLRRYLAWVKGIVDAIDKNYLKEIFVMMKDPCNDELVESYRFYLKYNTDGNRENRHTPTQVKDATLELLQVIYDLGKCNKLMEKIDVQLELTYCDITPESYEPPGFEASVGKYCLSIPNCSNHLATLKTGFHKLACYGNGRNLERPLTPFVPSECANTEEQRIEAALDASTVPNDSTNDTEEIKDIVPKTSTAKVPLEELNISNITVSDTANNISLTSGRSGSVVMTEEHFSCICQLPLPLGVLDVETINCTSCQRSYHAPCHGYLSKDVASQSVFVCICCDTNDQILRQFNKADRPLLARVRLILYYMDKFGKLPTNILKLISEPDRKAILQKLDTFNLLTKGNTFDKTRKVTLKMVLPKLFTMNDSQLLY